MHPGGQRVWRLESEGDAVVDHQSWGIRTLESNRRSGWFTDSVTLARLEYEGRISMDDWFLGTVHHLMRISGATIEDYECECETKECLEIAREAFRIWGHNWQDNKGIWKGSR